MAHLLLHLLWPRGASEKIWRTSSLVVVISAIGPCSDPGDELTMTAHFGHVDDDYDFRSGSEQSTFSL